jgi:hypothetical protein
MVTTDWRDMPRFENFNEWTMADPRFGPCADINTVESGAPSTRALPRSVQSRASPPAGLSGSSFPPVPQPPLPALRKSIRPFREADLQERLISRGIGTARRALGLGEAFQTERATAQAPPKPRGTKEIVSMAGIWNLVENRRATRGLAQAS